MNIKKLLLPLFLLGRSIFATEPIVNSINGKSGNLNSSGTITQYVIAPSNSFDSNTINVWLFRGGSSANETGYTGTFNTSSLTATQNGSVAAATLDEITGTNDDGYSRAFDGTDDYFSTSNAWGLSSTGDWTVEAYALFDNVAGVSSSVVDGGYKVGTNNGMGLIQESSKVATGIDTGTTDSYVQTSNSVSNGVWYHLISMKKSTTYYVAFSTTIIRTIADYNAITSGNKNSATNSGTFTGQTVYLGARSGGSANRLDGKIGWIRLSNFARYQ